MRASLVALAAVALSTAACTPGSGSAVCGNGVCESAENAIQCARDCGSGNVCGNALCEPGETTANCAKDCIGFVAVCGNAICEGGETATTCAQDCVIAGTECGNNVCEAGESYKSCSSDCTDPLDVTGLWNLTVITGYYYSKVYDISAPMTLTEKAGAVTGGALFAKSSYEEALMTLANASRTGTSLTGDVTLLYTEYSYSNTYMSEVTGTIDWVVSPSLITGTLAFIDSSGYDYTFPVTATR